MAEMLLDGKVQSLKGDMNALNPKHWMCSTDQKN